MRFIIPLLFAASLLASGVLSQRNARPQVCTKMKIPRCNRFARFRSLSGVCNNLREPFAGAALTAFRRLLPADYADGVSEPRKANRPFRRREPLPNARNVSFAIFKETLATSQTLTHMAMVFGQFLAHDITLAGQPEDFTCDGSCQPGPENECFGIPANKTGDPAFPGSDGVNCIILRRNKPCVEEAKTRDQENILSAFIDASHVYGVNEEEANNVRDRTNAGLLRTMPQNITSLEDLMPPANPHTPCRTSDPKNRPCFLSGDFRRNNENQGLNTMHTLWVREHNRIAQKLAQINPNWRGNKLFRETRRIIGAMMQHITYNEFLPAILGDATMDFFDLKLLDSGRFTLYNASINPGIPNSFATAALRFGHSTIRDEFKRIGKSLNAFPAIPTEEFLNPEFLYETENGGLDSIIRGMATDEAGEVDGFFARAILRYHLGEGSPNGPSRGDLLSLNIQRGREHGLPSYNVFRHRCGFALARQFSDLENSHKAGNIADLRKVYEKVDDIDLFVGGILERARDFGPQPADPRRRSRLGPTFAHIIATTFRDLRFGDRFWYETDQRRTRFTLRQLGQLRKASLARIICDNSDGIHQIQPQVLRQKSFDNDVTTSCDDLPFVGLQAWKVQDNPILH